ncbi:N-acetyllactosaminide beta-1,6-N-acetylglucosaminyl-transferase-like [Xenia sp. Carnegie-2017]|uniref:N-acetyllactosaminide beta-1,6-N-acetylglucosaminyl-transferase-like n=1 Tax=Xenia sp. Carnegie-2017 TaxID=2897299 RepID=UPI001F04ADDA|nr:N-acetyllactosaminide beta-1,6-N-acetylglucosaminyl-transferase-like [Xenia sp. Carnegie-2017]
MIEFKRNKWVFGVLLLFSVLLIFIYMELSQRVIIEQTNIFLPQINPSFAAFCKRVIEGDRDTLEEAKEIMDHSSKHITSPEEYMNLTKDCSKFKRVRGYIMTALDAKERDFPLAFSINVYKHVEQFERLLRAIYRPQNFYCIHVDKKSPDIFYHAVEAIAACFPNIFLASKRINILWGDFTILESILLCSRDLLSHEKPWKYLINLTGQEFPLCTNNEIVDKLHKMNGFSIVPAKPAIDSKTRNRFLYVHRDLKRTEILKKKFRINFTFYKGSVYTVLTRMFVNYTLYDKLALDFWEWLKDTAKPDETFYSTLYQNIKLEGHRNGTVGNPHTRYVVWHKDRCHGKTVRYVCINGVGDLKAIARSPALFVNKFYLDYEHLALDCLETWFQKRTLYYYASKKKIKR